MAINKPVIYIHILPLANHQVYLSFNQGTQSSWNCLVPDLISVGNVNRYGPLKITDYRNTHKAAICGHINMDSMDSIAMCGIEAADNDVLKQFTAKYCMQMPAQSMHTYVQMQNTDQLIFN